VRNRAEAAYALGPVRASATADERLDALPPRAAAAVADGVVAALNFPAYDPVTALPRHLAIANYLPAGQ